MEKLKQELNNANIPFVENQPLAQKSTFKIGSTCKVFTAPTNLHQFQEVFSIAEQQRIKYFVLGGGSNTVFPDNPYEGLIISTENLKKIEIIPIETENPNEIYIKCQAGTPMASLVSFCTTNNIGGLSQFAGLPGSVGGAVFMNARCFDKSINDIFYSGEYLDLSSETPEIKTIDYNKNQWSYKKSPFQQEETEKSNLSRKIIFSATFKLIKLSTEEEKHQLEEKAKYYISERVSKGHFKYPSAGSVFKNNHDFGKPSGQIIDEAGLKGYKIGGAQIAPFHGNFIININNATSQNIKDLVNYTIKVVEEKFSFHLEPEIIFL